jgi:hypothetical protein
LKSINLKLYSAYEKTSYPEFINIGSINQKICYNRFKTASQKKI